MNKKANGSWLARRALFQGRGLLRTAGRRLERDANRALLRIFTVFFDRPAFCPFAIFGASIFFLTFLQPSGQSVSGTARRGPPYRQTYGARKERVAAAQILTMLALASGSESIAAGTTTVHSTYLG